MTEALGIHQSDIIIRTALVAGINELRAQPQLLNYVFSSLPKDAMTAQEYGEREVDNAKRWFMKTEIPVFMNTRLDEAKLPAITIELLSSTEDAASLGDINPAASFEETEAVWSVLAGPFAASGYNPATGEVTVPSNVATELLIIAGMNLIDSTGKTHAIIDAGYTDRTKFKIAKNVSADFTRAYIKSASPTVVTSVESVVHREVYRIGCHVQSESIYLSYLWSIVLFVLNRGKQKLLEARGFERQQTSSSQFQLNPGLSTNGEVVYSRYIDLSGYVRQYWPKDSYEKGRSLSFNTLIVGGNQTVGPAVDENGKTINEDALWLAEDRDILGFR